MTSKSVVSTTRWGENAIHVYVGFIQGSWNLFSPSDLSTKTYLVTEFEQWFSNFIPLICLKDLKSSNLNKKTSEEAQVTRTGTTLKTFTVVLHNGL